MQRRSPQPVHVLAGLLSGAAMAGVGLAHHLPNHLVALFTAAPPGAPLRLPLAVPLWLPWGAGLIALVTWQRQTGRHSHGPAAHLARWPALGVTLALALIVAAGAAARMWAPEGTIRSAAGVYTDYDEAVYAGAAMLLRRGSWPYRDFVLVHPPLGPTLVAGMLAVRGVARLDLATFVALRQATALLDMTAAIGCYLVVRRLAGPPAGLLAALTYAATGLLIALGHQVMLEQLQAPLLAFAAAAYVRCLDQPGTPAGRQRAVTWSTLAGALVVAAAGVKLLGAVAGIAMAAHLLALRRLRLVAALVAGGLLAALILLSPFVLVAGAAMVEQTVLAQFGRTQPGLAGFRRRDAILATPDQLLLALAAALGLLHLGVAAARRWVHPGWILLVAWGTALWAALEFAPSFYTHYIASLALPLACVAGASLSGSAGLQPASPACFPEPGTVPTRRWSRVARAWRHTGPLLLSGIVLMLALRREAAAYPTITRDDFIIDDVVALQQTLPPGSNVLAFQPMYSLLAGFDPPRLPDGTYFLDTFLGWHALQPDQATAMHALLDQADAVLTDERLALADPAVVDALLRRLRAEFWYQPLAHQQLLVRVDVPERRVEFAGSATLLSTGSLTWQPSEVRLLSYWRATTIPTPDHALFAHLLDAQGQRVAQSDLPLQREYPWQPGDVMPIPIVVPLPAPMADGEYRLLVGVYAFSTGIRAPAFQAGHAFPDDAVAIATLRCQRGACRAVP